MELLQQYQVNGIKLHFQRTGSGQPILFIPGSISDYRIWNHISSQFDNQFSCYVLSRRFQYPDKYPKGGDSSIAANSADIVSFINNMKLAPVILAGHSYGGYIALNIAIKHPQLVKSVVAEEPIFAPALVTNPKKPWQLLGLFLRNFKAGKSFARLGMKGIDPTFKSLAKNDFASAQRSFIDGITDGTKKPEHLPPIIQQQLADNIASLEGEDPFNTSLKLADAKSIHCRVLLISGTLSPYTFQFINEQLEKTIPGAKHVYIQGATHWVHNDQPTAFTRAVMQFIHSKQ